MSKKCLLIAAAVLAGPLMTTLAQPASAATISITSQITAGNAPVEGDAAPLAGAVNFTQGVIGSSSGNYLSPYANNTNGTTNTPYNVINSGGSGTQGDAFYNVGASSYSILWGSPDSYNEIAFFAGADGTGGQIGSTLSGCALTPSCTGAGFDLATFTVSSGSIGSVELIDTGQAAFEFGTVSATPLPATLPLFAGGLGFVGYLTGRKKRKAGQALAAA